MRRTLLVRLWRRRREARRALSTLGHDAPEQVIGAVPQRWGRRLRRAGVLGRTAQGGRARVAAASLELAVESLDLLVVPARGG